MLRKAIFPLWIVASILLFLYSFTQVDLSLTLSRASIFQEIEKSFQYVGFFNRPLSALLYVLLLIFLFALYAVTLKIIRKKQIDRKMLWKVIICVSVILFVSYNAFSYDLFNYIFDAKILTQYHLNPYEFKALDFPTDPMLSFMRWTHRTYPYGPAWLAITAPISFVGFGYFIVTFYLFKLLMAASFIGSAFLIEKIARSINSGSNKLGINPLFAVAAFALNPLVLVESLVSSHNDIVMMFFAILGLYLYLEKKYVGSLVSIAVSIGIKFATIFMLPAFIAQKVLKLNDDKFIKFLIVLMAFTVVFVSVARMQFQPWYLLYVLPFAALMQEKRWIMIPVFFVSLGALLQYLPYIYLGNWDPPVPEVLNYMLFGSIIISVIFILVFGLVKPKKVE